MSVLLLATHFDGKLGPATLRAVTAAKGLGGEVLGGEVSVLVAGAGCAGVAAEAAAIDGVAEVICVNDPALAMQPADGLAAALHDNGTDFSHIVGVADSFGRDAIGRLGANLDRMPVTEVIAVNGANRFDRPAYAGNAIESVTVTGSPILLTVRAAAFAPAGRRVESAPITNRAYRGPPPLQTLVSRAISANRDHDLATARVVVGGGQSLANRDNFRMIGELAGVLDGAVGATRAAVDLGLVPNAFQIGQTGRSISPELYLAIGISGAQQHISGIKDAKKIVAINSDPKAPIIEHADAWLIGDLFEIVPELIARLKLDKNA